METTVEYLPQSREYLSAPTLPRLQENRLTTITEANMNTQLYIIPDTVVHECCKSASQMDNISPHLGNDLVKTA